MLRDVARLRNVYFNRELPLTSNTFLITHPLLNCILLKTTTLLGSASDKKLYFSVFFTITNLTCYYETRETEERDASNFNIIKAFFFTHTHKVINLFYFLTI